MLLAVAFVCQAELEPLDEASLSNISAQEGIGLIIDDVGVYADNGANVQLTFDTNLGGSDAAIFDHFSLYGSDSNAICDANPSATNCNGVTIGSFADPITLNVISDNDGTYLELDWVKSASGNDSGIDIQTRFLTITPGVTGTGAGNNYKLDATWTHLKDFTIADSSVKMWSNNTGINSFETVNGIIDTSRPINGGLGTGVGFEVLLNSSFSFSADIASDLGTSFVGASATGPTNEQSKLAPFSNDDRPRSADGTVASQAGVWELQNVQISNLALGYYPVLPLRFGSIDNDVGGTANKPDFFVEVPIVPNNPAIYQDFYANQPKANITIGNVRLGNDISGNPFNVGSASITGIRIQHLRFETNL